MPAVFPLELFDGLGGRGELLQLLVLLRIRFSQPFVLAWVQFWHKNPVIISLRRNKIPSVFFGPVLGREWKGVIHL